VMEKLCLNSFGWIIPGGGIKIFKMMQKWCKVMFLNACYHLLTLSALAFGQYSVFEKA
jgi:hypothetical protein